MTTRTTRINYDQSSGYYGRSITGAPEKATVRSVVAAVDTRSGSPVPGWFKIIAAGGDATSGYTRELTSLSPLSISSFEEYETIAPNYPLGRVGNRTGWGNGRVFTDIALSVPGPVSSSGVASAASANFVNFARRQQTSFSGGVFLGELAATVRMLRNPLVGLRSLTSQYLTRVKKHVAGAKNRRSARRNLRELYLEYTYGWVPLSKDVEDAMRALSDRQRTSHTSRVSGQSSKRSTSQQRHVTNGFSVGQIAVEQLDDSSYSVRCGGAVRIQNSGYTRQVVGLDKHSFAPTLWELLPWSFVVDYFTNIGDVISAYSFNWASVPYSFTSTRDVRQSSYISAQFISTALSGLKYRSRSLHLSRGHLRKVVFSRSSGVRPPVVHFDLPSLRQGFNLAALADQLQSTQGAVNRRWR